MSVQSYFPLLNPLIFSIFSIAFLCVSAASNNARAAALFSGSYAIGATAFTVDFFRNAFPDMVAAFLANGLYTATTVIFTIGMCVRYRSGVSARFLIISGVVGYGVYLALYAMAPGMWVRSIGINFANGVLLMIGVFSTAANVKKPIDRIIYVLFVAAAVQCFLRPLLVYHFSGGDLPEQGYTHSAFFYALHLTVGAVAIALATCLMIAQGAELIVELAGRSSLDPMTGLLNRSGFEFEASSRLVSAEETAALVVGDLDQLNQYNDSIGFSFGDRLIVEFSRVIRAFSNGERAAARLSAGRFAIFAPGVRLEEARAIADAIRRNFANAVIETPAGRLRHTASVGVAGRRRGEPLSDVLARAERALAMSKIRGGDQTTTEAEIPEIALAADDDASRRIFQRHSDFQYKAL